MKKLLLISIISLFTMGLSAQSCHVPKDYVLKKAEDYVKYEKDVIACFDWLMKTPANEQLTKQKKVKAFLLAWISGSPKVSIEIHPDLVNFTKKNPDLLFIFMAGWTKYSIQNKDYTDVAKGTLAGIESVITYYQKNIKFLKKDKHVEKYIKMKEEGFLIKHIEDTVANRKK